MSIVIPLVSGVVLGAMSVIFFLQNITFITVSFMWWSVTAPVALVIFSAILLGILVVSLMLAWRSVRGTFSLKFFSRQKKEEAGVVGIGSPEQVTQ